ncbi:hypothetical protein [Glaesserella parasuis]
MIILLDVGRWTLDVGRWTLDVGRWTLDVGRSLGYLYLKMMSR